MAGDYIKKLLGAKGNVVELQGIPGSSAARDRGAGFNAALESAPAMKRVASQPADFNRAKGLSFMENILQSQPNIAAMFAHNDAMALGAMHAITSSKRKIIVVGVDATPDAVAACKVGRLSATVA